MEIIKKLRFSRAAAPQNPAAPEPVPTTEHKNEALNSEQAEPVKPYAVVKQILEEFKTQNWFEKGKTSGLQMQSTTQTCENEVEGIIYKFIDLYMDIYKILHGLTPGAEIDTINEGSQGERAAIARVNREYLEKELARCVQQIEMEHVSNQWSECISLIRAYRNGFEAGSRIRLRNNGLYY